MVSLLSRLIPRLTPCLHAFCNDCMRHRMSRGGRTTCVLCSKQVSTVIVSSAPMETPASSKSTETTAVESASTDAYGIPTEIQRRLPSLAKMQPFWKFSFTRMNDPEERIIENFMRMNEDDTGDLQCRLAIAQILKDIDFPHEPIPQYAKNVITGVLRDPYYWRNGKRKDLIHLLQSLDITE